MRKLFYLVSTIVVVSCSSGKKEANTTMKDSIEIENVEIVMDVTPQTPIEGMEESDMPEFGIKAWISDGEVYWNVYDKEKYITATQISSEFYRVGDGPLRVDNLEEVPVGVRLAKLNKKGDLALYIISDQRHLFAFDISLEVSGVGGGVGQIDGIERVQRLEQEGDVVYSVDDQENMLKVEFYSGEGPYQCAVNDGENEYYFEFNTTWNMRLIKDNLENYSGRFKRGENGYYTYTLTKMFRYDDQWRKQDVPITPIHGSFRLNVKKGTIMFNEELIGLPNGVQLEYEVFPLFE